MKPFKPTTLKLIAKWFTYSSLQYFLLGQFLLLWIKTNPSMDKYSHARNLWAPGITLIGILVICWNYARHIGTTSPYSLDKRQSRIGCYPNLVRLSSWWRDAIETLFPSLALFVGNHAGIKSLLRCYVFVFVSLNTLRPRQNGRYWADDVSKCTFFECKYINFN